MCPPVHGGGLSALRQTGDDGESYVVAEVTRIRPKQDPSTKGEYKRFKCNHLGSPLSNEERLSPDCFQAASRDRQMVSFTEPLSADLPVHAGGPLVLVSRNVPMRRRALACVPTSRAQFQSGSGLVFGWRTQERWPQLRGAMGMKLGPDGNCPWGRALGKLGNRQSVPPPVHRISDPHQACRWGCRPRHHYPRHCWDVRSRRRNWRWQCW